MKPPRDKTPAPASNTEWKAWGDIDPLYGVATTSTNAKDGANPWTDESFYQLGVTDWELFRPKWQQYGVNPGACLEIGCGAGRLTVQLARFFQTVDAVDVSPGMVAYARERVPGNVSLHVTGGLDLPLSDGSVDGVFSTHVLQHLSSTEAAATYFRDMYRVLRPGGSVMIHLPIIVWPWGSLLGAHKLVHKAKAFRDGMYATLGRQAFRMGLRKAPPMQVIWYEINWLYRTLQSAGFTDIEIRLLFGGSKMAVQHPFVFARKK